MPVRMPRHLRSRMALAAGACAVLVSAAACGGAAATAAPTPVPTIEAIASTAATATPTAAPTEQPTTAPTPAPTETPAVAASPEPSASADATRPAPGTFLYGYQDMLAYYQSQGYECQEPGASAVAAGYTAHMCAKVLDGTSSTQVIGFLFDKNGTLGDVFAGLYNEAGGTMPSNMDAIVPLAFILGATLGDTDGQAAATWLADNMGGDMATTTINGNTVRTYTVNDKSQVGVYSEVSTPVYEAAPAP